MNSGQYPGQEGRHVSKRVHRRYRSFITLVFVLLTLGFAVGGTIAFIMTQTDEKRNVFDPARVSCEVTEDFNGTEKSRVAVKNTGSTAAYIRAAVYVAWRKDTDESDQTITARTPQKGTDYDMIYADTGWIKGVDGYWYYPFPVAPEASTDTLIETCTQLATADVPEGCHLAVEIVASAIQASPETVVSTEWKVVVADGKIVNANKSGVTGE